MANTLDPDVIAGRCGEESRTIMAVDIKEVEKQADDLGLEGDLRTKFLEIFQHDKPFENLGKRGLRLSEFNSRMDKETKALQTARETHEAQMTDLQEQLEAVGRLRTDSAAEVDKVRAEMDKINTKAFQSEQALRRVAGDAGLDPDKYLESIGHEPVKPAEGKKEDAIDTSRYIDRQSFGQGIKTSVMTTAALMKVNNEHRKLFGSDLENPDALVNYVIEQGAKGRDISIPQAWEELNKVPEKREEVRAADVDRRIKDAERATEVRVRSEMAIGRPSTGREHSESPALQLAKGTGRGQVSEHLMASAQRLADARASLATGKP